LNNPINRQSDRQTDRHRWKNNLLGGGNSKDFTWTGKAFQLSSLRPTRVKPRLSYHATIPFS